MNDYELLYLEKSIAERIKASGLTDNHQLAMLVHTKIRLNNLFMDETLTYDEIWENVHELLTHAIRRQKSFYNE